MQGDTIGTLQNEVARLEAERDELRKMIEAELLGAANITHASHKKGHSIPRWLCLRCWEQVKAANAAKDAALRSAPAPIANADYRVHSAWQLEYAAWRDNAQAALSPTAGECNCGPGELGPHPASDHRFSEGWLPPEVREQMRERLNEEIEVIIAATPKDYHDGPYYRGRLSGLLFVRDRILHDILSTPDALGGGK